MIESVVSSAQSRKSRNHVTTSTESIESRYGKGLQFHYSHPAAAALVFGVLLAAVPIGRADVAFVGLALIGIGLYLFMRESAKTIRWFATPMIAVFGWLAIVSGSGSMARWTPAVDVSAAARAQAAAVTVTGAPLKADVQLTGAQFLISNGAQQPWTNVTLSLTGSDRAIYTSRLDRIDAGGTVVVQLGRFTGGDGHPFRTATIRPESLRIAAQLGDQGGTYAVRLR